MIVLDNHPKINALETKIDWSRSKTKQQRFVDLSYLGQTVGWVQLCLSSRKNEVD
jgi:hypothetical protein